LAWRPGTPGIEAPSVLTSGAVIPEIEGPARQGGEVYCSMRGFKLFTNRRNLIVVCCALAGAIVGTYLYRYQPGVWEGMNPLGVVAFACLAASGGCLWIDR
jgi:hypothetical protein